MPSEAQWAYGALVIALATKVKAKYIARSSKGSLFTEPRKDAWMGDVWGSSYRACDELSLPPPPHLQYPMLLPLHSIGSNAFKDVMWPSLIVYPPPVPRHFSKLENGERKKLLSRLQKNAFSQGAFRPRLHLKCSTLEPQGRIAKKSARITLLR